VENSQKVSRKWGCESFELLLGRTKQFSPGNSNLIIFERRQHFVSTLATSTRMKSIRSISSSLYLVMMILCLHARSNLVEAGPIMAGSAVAACYTACNAGYIVCMTGSGLVAGTTGPVGWWAWATGAAAGCSVVQGACMTTCAAVGLAATAAPTP